MTRLERTSQTLVVADLDGTLTFTEGQPVREVMDAWDQLAAVPTVRMAVATARAPVFVRDWFRHRLLHTDAVCCNGALVLAAGEAGAPWALPVPAVRRVTRLLATRGVSYRVDYGEYFVARGPDSMPWMVDAHRRELAPDVAPRCDGVVRMLVSCSETARRAAHGLRGVSVIAHSTGDADIVATGVGKRGAVAGLRRDSEQLIALGNDENDRELLGAADAAFVVGTGLADLDAAPHVRRVPAGPGPVAELLTGLADSLARQAAPVCG